MIKVVNPNVEFWKQEGYSRDAIWKHIARCARVCYQSVPKDDGESAYQFLVRTLFRGVEPEDINTKDLVKSLLPKISLLYWPFLSLDHPNNLNPVGIPSATNCLPIFLL